MDRGRHVRWPAVLVLLALLRGAAASVNDELARLLPAAEGFSAACGGRRDSELGEHLFRDGANFMPPSQRQQWDSCNHPDAVKLAADALRAAGAFAGLPASESSETADENPNPNPNSKISIPIMTKNGESKAVRVPQRAFQFYRQARELEQTLQASHGERMELVTAAARILELARSMQDLCNMLSEEAPS